MSNPPSKAAATPRGSPASKPGFIATGAADIPTAPAPASSFASMGPRLGPRADTAYPPAIPIRGTAIAPLPCPVVANWTRRHQHDDSQPQRWGNEPL